MSSMNLEIVTPEGSVFNGEIKEATLPGEEGEFGVLPEHASLLSLLGTGVITIVKANGNEEGIAIDGGYAKVEENKTLCVVEGAVAISGDSESEIAKALDDAKELLSKASDSATAIAKVESLSRKSI
ncbi:MAG: ATP synthase F1 subunit epsilon [Campylobacterota bacterium]